MSFTYPIRHHTVVRGAPAHSFVVTLFLRIGDATAQLDELITIVMVMGSIDYAMSIMD